MRSPKQWLSPKTITGTRLPENHWVTQTTLFDCAATAIPLQKQALLQTWQYGQGKVCESLNVSCIFIVNYLTFLCELNSKDTSLQLNWDLPRCGWRRWSCLSPRGTCQSGGGASPRAASPYQSLFKYCGHCSILDLNHRWSTNRTFLVMRNMHDKHNK
jgi:hypothetical protein